MTPSRRLSRLAPLALVPALLLAACTTSDKTETTLAFIELVPRAVTLQEGDTRRLTAIGTYSDGSVLPLTSGVTFSSSDPGKATVSADGTITAVAAGATTIVATAASRTATCAVTVTAGPPRLLSIAVTPATVPLLVGGPTQALTVTATFSSGPATDVTSSSAFTTSAPAVATVSTGGVVTAVAAGSATITATYSGQTATAAVTVTVRTLQSIAVTPATVPLPIGGTQALTVTGTYDVGPTANLTSTAGTTYESSAPAVATVSSGGVVTAVAVGTATITATASGKTSTSAVTVSAPVLLSIAVTPATPTLAVGGTQQLTVTATYDVGPTGDVTGTATYESSAPAVASVSAAGVVTALTVGTTTITATFSAKTATALVTVSAITTTGGKVFFDDYEPGVSFAPFGGSTNDVARDTVELNPASGGRASLKVAVPNGNYTGGAFVTSVPRDLRAFNAVTFWAKASTANALNVAGLGDNAATTPPPFSAEVLNFPLTGTWTKFVVPLPDPSKLVGSNGLFHFAEGGDNYTIWFSDIQYETLGATEVGPPTGVTVNWPALTVAVAGTSQLAWQPNTVTFDTPALPTGGSLKNVGFAWYTLTSSAPAVATVSTTGLVTGVSGGTASISATMNGLAVSGNAAITVTAPLALPTTIAPTPTVGAANVISLFSSAYSNVGVDTWQTSWSAGNSALVDPYVIAGHDVKQYTLSNFVGIEFGLATPANTVNATAMTHFHVDLWSPNPPSNIEIQLVNDPGGPAAHIGAFQAGAIASGSWVSLEIPLDSFTNLTTREALRQLLFVGSGPTVLYVDNVYFHN